MASTRLTKEMISEAKKLLESMGLPWVQAPEEGEAQAAAMCSNGEVYASASQDFDSLLFGAPLLVRNLTLSGRRKVPRKDEYVDVFPEMIELAKTLSGLGISREQLIWIGILVGTDFNKGVKGIGPKKAIKLVKECTSLDEVVTKSAGEFEVEPKDLESFFLHPKSVLDYPVEFRQPDPEAVVKFLVDEHDFSKERVQGAAKAFAGKMSETLQQSKLGEWFG